jgi:putative membrane protein
MKKPVAIDIDAKPAPKRETKAKNAPQAFDLANIDIRETELNLAPTQTEFLPPQRRSLWSKLFWGALAFLVSLGFALALERLISDLFARYPALGWAGLGATALMLLALVALIARELLAIFRLHKLEHLRKEALEAHQNHNLASAKKIAQNVRDLYGNRADCARQVTRYDAGAEGVFDADHVLPFAERELQHPLDKRARQLIAASSRRIALVTSVSPRAVVDIGFVLYESIRLSRHIAALYGARPGFFGFMSLAKAILSHLALTGGIALGDSILQQLLGHGVAARVSTKLGEGVINGLMTVRVGIAAMRVTRPLPFLVGKPPSVSEFLPELVKLAKDDSKG